MLPGQGAALERVDAAPSRFLLLKPCPGPGAQPAPPDETIPSQKTPSNFPWNTKHLFSVLLQRSFLPRLKMKAHGCRVALSPLSPLGSIWKRLVLHLFDMQVNSFPSSQPRLPVLAIWKAGLEINRQTLGRGSRKKTQNRFEKRPF